jgi:hypothetical protein
MSLCVEFAEHDMGPLPPAIVEGPYRPLVKIVERPSVALIRERVAAHFNIPVAELVGPRRWRPYVVARQAGMFLARKLTDKSYPEIGRFFGSRDHTTVMHGVRATLARIEGDPGLAEGIKAIEADLPQRRRFSAAVEVVWPDATGVAI